MRGGSRQAAGIAQAKTENREIIATTIAIIIASNF